MKDARLIAAFVMIGLVAAWFATAPLRRSDTTQAPAEETSRLQPDAPPAQVYAEGTVDVTPGFKPTAPALFLIARAASGGAPLAVKRVASPLFPVTFSLSLADSMVGSTDFYSGDLVVVARLDQDGLAGPRQPGDVESSVEIKAGAPRAVRLVLSAPAS